MRQKLIDVLKTFGYPVKRQGSFNQNEAYPDTFITYWTTDADDHAHYDDEPTAYAWDFAVIIYSNNPEIIEAKKDEIKLALKNAGFIPQGKGRDIASDVPTHTGWAMDFYYIENEK